MTIKRCSLVIAFFLALAGVARPVDSGRGSVEGKVVDFAGKPVNDATVFISNRLKGPTAQTDAEGNFSLENVTAGDVSLRAYKESDCYPYNMFSFFAMPGEQPARFVLASGEVKRNVVIHLGARAGILVVQITNEQGLPVVGHLMFSRPDRGQYGLYERTSSEDEPILLPPVPMRLTVDAPGYEVWHFGGDDWQTEKGLLQPKSGETLKLSIVLHKTAG